MGSTLTLTASDGHRFAAYRADPAGTPRGGIVIVQEIFGVNDHIRAVADGFAAEGYSVVAPALFDRIERGTELPYDAHGTARGRALRTQLGWDAPLRDMAAAIEAAAASGPVSVVGFCWGGSIAWLSATRLRIAAAVCYYGGQIIDFVDETPTCPVLLHFGEKDPLIPRTAVETIRSRQTVEIHLYPAGHGFNCDQRHDYDARSAELSMRRTLAFLRAHANRPIV